MCENRYGIGGSGSPIVPDEHETSDPDRVGEVEDILSESAGLTAEGVRIVDARGAEAAQVGHEHSQWLAFQVIDHAIPGAKAVRKTVEQD